MNKQQLEAKKILLGANCLDMSIQSKIEQIRILNEMATNATSTLSDMPGSSNRNVRRMEEIVVRIVDMQEEIASDIYKLILRKKQIKDCIDQVQDLEGRTILEKRYLVNQKWEDIAADTSLSMRQVFRIHDSALGSISISERWQ